MKLFTLFFLFAALMLGSSSAAAQDELDYELPYYERVSAFKLINQRGEDFGTAQLKGRVWIANFFFTRCERACPYFSSQMAELQNRLRGSKKVLLVSFSVDPNADQPKELKKYAAYYGARPGRWYFLTGDKGLIWGLIKDTFELRVAAATVEEVTRGAEALILPYQFVLVDQERYVRGYYDVSDAAGLKVLADDAEALALSE